MIVDTLERPTVRMPDFGPGEWLNSPRPLDRAALRGSVVLVDFWEYTCVNCLRTLPYLRAWHERYASRGLVIVGVHAPEFAFGRVQPQLATAVAELGIPYAVLLDNDYQTWTRFANRAWPGKHLVDAAGYVRWRHYGEGAYGTAERAIQTLLRQRDPNVVLPPILPPQRPEDAPGAVCYRATPELHAGYQGGGLRGGALGNPEGYGAGSPLVYRLPPDEERQVGRIYLDGIWTGTPESVAFAGQEAGRLVLAYEATGVNAVLSPTDDPVSLRLGLWRDERPPRVSVQLDGRWLSPADAGTDVRIDADGRSYLNVERPRLYALARTPAFGRHEVALTFETPGVAAYAFTFESCLDPAATANGRD